MNSYCIDCDEYFDSNVYIGHQKSGHKIRFITHYPNYTLHSFSASTTDFQSIDRIAIDKKCQYGWSRFLRPCYWKLRRKIIEEENQMKIKYFNEGLKILMSYAGLFTLATIDDATLHNSEGYDFENCIYMDIEGCYPDDIKEKDIKTLQSYGWSYDKKSWSWVWDYRKVRVSK